MNASPYRIFDERVNKQFSYKYITLFTAAVPVIFIYVKNMYKVDFFTYYLVKFKIIHVDYAVSASGILNMIADRLDSRYKAY